MAIEPDYYEILQVSAEAEDEVIGAAYKRLARKYHPDLNPDMSAIRRMRELNRAIEVLGDPQKRREYDSRRKRAGGLKTRPGLLAGGHGPAADAAPRRSRVILFAFFFVAGAILGLALILAMFIFDTGGGAPAPAAPPSGDASVPTATPAAAGASSAPATPEPTTLAGGGTFSNGTWLVGEEIAPGLWRAVRSRTCQWKRLSSIEGEVDTVAGSGSQLTVQIKPADAAFWSDGCGWWSQVLTPPSAGPSEPFGPGTWLVGKEIAPGLWQNSDGSEGCAWARLSRLDGEPSATTATGATRSTLVIELIPSDYAFHSWGCGTWTRLS